MTHCIPALQFISGEPHHNTKAKGSLPPEPFAKATAAGKGLKSAVRRPIYDLPG